VKYRKKWLVGVFSDDAKQLIFEITKEKGFTIDTMQTDVDHIHILINASPAFSPFQIAHQFKQLTTFRIWKKYSDKLKQVFWKERTLWSDGYFVCTTGNASTETIQKYINEQG
jgi:putative transposase